MSKQHRNNERSSKSEIHDSHGRDDAVNGVTTDIAGDIVGDILIGQCKVSLNACTVRRDDCLVKVTPRSMDVLRYLIRHPGTVISQTELLDNIWRSSIAGDHAVHKAIAELRSALQDNAHKPTYIKTVPKRGYSLIAEIKPAASSQTASSPSSPETASAQPETAAAVATRSRQRFHFWPLAPRTASSWTLSSWSRGLALTLVLLAAGIFFLNHDANPRPGPPLPTNDIVKLAVMPFVSREASNENLILAEGIRESLVHGLAKLSHLQVLAPSRANEQIQISGIALNDSYLQQVDHYLQGSVHGVEGRLRVIVQLVRVEDGVHQYSDQFDLPMQDIFAVQDEIVSNVVSALRIHLDDQERRQMLDWGTNNALAYERFLRAEFYYNQFNPTDFERAIYYYQAAIEQDANFLSAWHGLATAANNLAVYSGVERINELYKIVLDVHREVSRLDPGSDILESLHAIKLRMSGNSYIALETQIREQILSGNPPDFAIAHYALLLIGARLYDEANEYLRLASGAGPFEISPDEGWSYGNAVKPPAERVLSGKFQLQQRPYHIGYLGTVAANLAFEGDFVQARSYLGQQQVVDIEGILSHYTESVIGFLKGDISHGSDAMVLALKDEQNLYYNNGALSFMLGDLERGIEYWSALKPVQLRRLFNMIHSSERFFPDEILESPAYHSLLESLGNGKGWQQRLMEGVMAMESVTGVSLSRKSRQAYDDDVLLVRNNLWSEDDWLTFNQRRAQIFSQQTRTLTADTH